VLGPDQGFAIIINQYHVYVSMPNYCPFCGRFMQMQDFEHACDRVNVARGVKEWCSRCGGRLDLRVDDPETAICHICASKLDPAAFPGDRG